jgi:hypothetical protein
MSWLTNVEAAATAALASGVALPQTIITEASTLFNGMSTSVNANLTTIMSNYTDPAVVADQVMKIKETSNLPPGVSALASALPATAAAAAADITKITGLTGIIAGIKAQL